MSKKDSPTKPSPEVVSPEVIKQDMTQPGSIGANPFAVGPGGKMSPELLKMVAAMQEQKMNEMPKHKRITMEFMKKIMPKFQAAVEHLDRFVNFISKKEDSDRNDVVQAARSPILFGTWVIIIFFGFGTLWAALAPLDSASHAMGQLVSSTSRKTLQHQQGGTVKTIHVNQGDRVKEGDPIVSLDETQFRANHDVALGQYRALKASESRLIAERDNLPNIDFSPELLKDAEQPEVAKILTTQRNLFNSKRDLINNLEKHSAQRIEQTKKTLDGLREKKIATHKAYEVSEDRLKGAVQLLAKGFLSKAQFAEIETKAAEATSQDINIEAEIIKQEQEISRIGIELMQQKSEMLTRAVTELKETQSALADAREKYVSAKDAFDKAIVTSPVDGIVNVMYVTTIGGVVGPGSPIAEVSPEKDSLIVEAKVSPKDVAYIYAGQSAKMNFTAYKSRTTPTFNGIVTSISPDIVMERQPVPGGESGYFIARIEIDMDEFNAEKQRLNLTPLLPGMQADVNIIRGTRTLLRYLLDPITDNMFKAFKEK